MPAGVRPFASAVGACVVFAGALCVLRFLPTQHLAGSAPEEPAGVA